MAQRTLVNAAECDETLRQVSRDASWQEEGVLAKHDEESGLGADA